MSSVLLALSEPSVLRVHSELAQVLFAENSGLNLSSLPGQVGRNATETLMKPQTALRLYPTKLYELQGLSLKMNLVSTNMVGAVGPFNHGSVHVLLCI